jgi:hypothetical protein
MDEVRVRPKNARLFIDEPMKKLELPHLILHKRIKSLNIRVRWLLDQDNLNGVLLHEDDLEIIFMIGCRGFSLESVVFQNPDEFFLHVKSNLLSEWKILLKGGSEREKRGQLVLLELRQKVESLDNLAIFYLLEWVINRFLAEGQRLD